MSLPLSALARPALIQAPAPSTPLGPVRDSAVTWTSWATLTAFTGLTFLALVLVAPARRQGRAAERTVRLRLSWAAVAAGLLVVPTALSDQAQGDSGFDYSGAWNTLFDGSHAGLLAGLEVFLPALGALLLLPVALRGSLSPRVVAALRTIAILLGVVALISTKFPAEAPKNYSVGVFETVMWGLHLLGVAVWLGGLAGLLLLSVRGGLDGAFWSAGIRRFSAAAMSCVAAIALSGSFLLWEHVDGPKELATTMYGRVLGTKLLIFGTLILLGAINQFWLHPRLEALRAAGDERPLRTILIRRFPLLVGLEALLVLTALFVAPFLHGSARNQAYQAEAAKHATAKPGAKPPRLGPKQVTTTTWVEGTAETAAVLIIMIGGYRFSGRLARRHSPVDGAPTSATVEVG